MTRIESLFERLRQRRHELGIPLNVISHKTGVSTSTVKRVLAGEMAASFSTVARIADVLGVDLQIKARSVDHMIVKQARGEAKRLVKMVQGTSALEAQAVDKNALRRMEAGTLHELLNGPRSKIWG